jgi:hypothetical protein
MTLDDVLRRANRMNPDFRARVWRLCDPHAPGTMPTVEERDGRIVRYCPRCWTAFEDGLSAAINAPDGAVAATAGWGRPQ